MNVAIILARSAKRIKEKILSYLKIDQLFIGPSEYNQLKKIFKNLFTDDKKITKLVNKMSIETPF